MSSPEGIQKHSYGYEGDSPYDALLWESSNLVDLAGLQVPDERAVHLVSWVDHDGRTCVLQSTRLSPSNTEFLLTRRQGSRDDKYVYQTQIEECTHEETLVPAGIKRAKQRMLVDCIRSYYDSFPNGLDGDGTEWDTGLNYVYSERILNPDTMRAKKIAKDVICKLSNQNR